MTTTTRHAHPPPAPHPPSHAKLDLHIDDLPVGSMRLVRADGRRLCLVRTTDGVHALDHACPHEGYGLTQGTLDGDLLTCAWHNWKFRVTDGTCIKGEEDVRTHPVTVDADGSLSVALHDPDPATLRPVLLDSLQRGIERNYVGQVARDVVRLLAADANPAELVWEAVAYGAPRADFGWGHAIASATDCLAMLDDFDGDQRALPIVQAIAGIAEVERGRSPNPLPDPAPAVRPDGGAEFRRLVEEEQLAAAQSLVRGAVHAGLGAEELRRWFTAAVSDHLLSYGHGAIYAQKAFQLLERIGWDRADTVLPYLVPTIVWATRMDTLPYMRAFTRELSTIDLAALSEVDPQPGWADDGTLQEAILEGGDRVRPLRAAVAALESGAGVDGVLDVVSLAVAERMLRYDPTGELDLHDDFGWLDITHGLTYANAVRWHADGRRDPDAVRLALWCTFLAHWTGRHEWHTKVGAPDRLDVGDDIVAAGRRLQSAALTDESATFIVHAHGVKTTKAATDEAHRTGSTLPLEAVSRFLTAPKASRFVAGTVARSIDLVRGRARRD